MADCIPYFQWLGANAACRDKSAGISVRGFGYTRTGVAGLRGLALRGLGDDYSVQAPVVSQPSLNTSAIDASDPCYIAQQTPCPMSTGCPASCPTGFHSVTLLAAPGKPAQCVCGKDKAASAPPTTTMTIVPGGSASAPPSSDPGVVQSNVAAGGFSHWGLLAAVAVGGTALYLVMRKKAA